MSLVAEVHLASPDLLLASTIRAVPAATLSIVYQGGERDLFVAVDADDAAAFAAVEDALRADPSVGAPALTTDAGDRRVYRLEVAVERTLLSRVLSEAGIRVLDSRSRADGWLLRLELPDREALSSVRRYCDEQGIAFRLQRLYRTGETGPAGTFGLTEDQRTTLLTAFVEGYFEVPRGTSQRELAAALGISESAVSQRLRRAVGRLVAETVAAEAEGPGGRR